MEKRWEEKERKRYLADAMKKDFKEEETKLLVLGYNFDGDDSRSIVPVAYVGGGVLKL